MGALQSTSLRRNSRVVKRRLSFTCFRRESEVRAFCKRSAGPSFLIIFCEKWSKCFIYTFGVEKILSRAILFDNIVRNGRKSTERNPRFLPLRRTCLHPYSFFSPYSRWRFTYAFVSHIFFRVNISAKKVLHKSAKIS